MPGHLKSIIQPKDVRAGSHNYNHHNSNENHLLQLRS